MEPIRDLNPQADTLPVQAKVYCLPLDPFDPTKETPLVIEITTTGLSLIKDNPDNTFESRLEEMQEVIHCELSVHEESFPSPHVHIKGCCSKARTHITLVESAEALVLAIRIFFGLDATMIQTTT